MKKNNASLLITMIVVAIIAVLGIGMVLKTKRNTINYDNREVQEESTGTVVEDISGTSAPESISESVDQESRIEDESSNPDSSAENVAEDSSAAESTSGDSSTATADSSTAAAPDPYQPDNFVIEDMPAELYSLITNPEQLRVGLYDYCFNNISKGIEKASINDSYSLDNGILNLSANASGYLVAITIDGSGNLSFALA